MPSPFFVLGRRGDLYHVAVVARDETDRSDLVATVELWTKGAGAQQGWSLRGRPAGLLYLALAGHPFGSDPATANPYAARTARALLATIQEPGFYMASLVIRHFGEIIVPGFGRQPQGERPKRMHL